MRGAVEHREALTVILLLAVGSDYNLLLVSRFKEEIPAGIHTGIIRSMAGSGSSKSGPRPLPGRRGRCRARRREGQSAAPSRHRFG
jgi:hypothetical protein